jgi:aromatic ring-opening dioxygenase catalytic subunit (LigB family)
MHFYLFREAKVLWLDVAQMDRGFEHGTLCQMLFYLFIEAKVLWFDVAQMDRGFEHGTLCQMLFTCSERPKCSGLTSQR